LGGRVSGWKRKTLQKLHILLFDGKRAGEESKRREIHNKWGKTSGRSFARPIRKEKSKKSVWKGSGI